MNKPDWIKPIEEREAKATPGPWERLQRYPKVEVPDNKNEVCNVRGIVVVGPRKAVSCGDEADFIMQARTDIPRLLSALNKALEALEGISKAGPEPRKGIEYEHWGDGNFDDSYEYGVEIGEFYAGETARSALEAINNPQEVE